jgi:predicted CoA-binding protein
VFGLPIHRTVEAAQEAALLTPHTITLYLRPEHQQPLYETLLALKPRRILFNPGTENPELEQLAQTAGIEAVEACTLVLLSRGAY